MTFSTSTKASSVSVQSFIEKNKIASVTPFLFLLEVFVKSRETGQVVSTIRVVKNPEPVDHMGHLYAASDFDFDFKSNEGEQSTVSLRVKDYKRSLQSIMQEHGGGVGSTVHLKVVNADRLSSPPDVDEIFQITQASAQSYEISWQLGAMDLLARRAPKRKQHRDRCSWKFKSKECGYQGTAKYCDLSFQGASGCSSHGNEENFGGFPGITIQRR